MIKMSNISGTMRKGLAVLVASVVMAVGIPAFAAGTAPEENLPLDTVTDVDYGQLTDAEIKELNDIYAQLDAKWLEIFGEDENSLSDSEFNARYDAYEEAIKHWDARLVELEEKAFPSDSTEDTVHSVHAVSSTKLNEEELSELEGIYGQIDQKWVEIFGEDPETLTDEDFEARFARFESETKELYEQAAVLEEKADYTDLGTMNFGAEDDLDASIDYGNLTEAEIAEVQDIYSQLGDILFQIFSGDLSELTETEFDAKWNTFEEQTQALNDRLMQLEEKSGLAA